LAQESAAAQRSGLTSGSQVTVVSCDESGSGAHGVRWSLADHWGPHVGALYLVGSPDPKDRLDRKWGSRPTTGFWLFSFFLFLFLFCFLFFLFLDFKFEFKFYCEFHTQSKCKNQTPAWRSIFIILYMYFDLFIKGSIFYLTCVCIFMHVKKYSIITKYSNSFIYYDLGITNPSPLKNNLDLKIKRN
jgi:hypothetical protein